MDNTILIEMSNYVKPEIKEVKAKGWVLNGKDNSYFDYVNERYIGSPTNSAIINGYCRLIYGLGLSAKDAHRKIEQYAKLKTILNKKDVKRVVNDFQLQGMAYFQVVESKGGELHSIKHIPVNTLAPEIADENNEINGYWYSEDWKDPKGKNEPEFIPAFGTKGKGVKIYAIKPYTMGTQYFNLPTYQAGLQYADLEEEISNFSNKHIKNGLSFGYVINIPDSASLTDEQKEELRRKIKNQLSGSNNAGSFIINFGDGDKVITVEPLQISDSHKQYQFLSSHAREQIITSHEVVSPMLFGIKEASGFSSNADELDIAEKQVLKRVIRPKQEEITDAFEDVLKFYGISLDLYFKPLTEETENIVQEQTTELSSQICCSGDKEASTEAADSLIALGEDFNEDEWFVLSETEVNYEDDNDLHGFLNLASTGVAKPNSKSIQDSKDIVIRYKYVGNKDPQREFCMKMMKADKVYRKEDIISMSSKTVNAGYGVKGADTYNIWLYKGSVNCKHKWNRVIYLKKNGSVDVNSPLAQTISTSEAKRRGYKVPTNDTLVSISPSKMPNGGAYPN